MGSIPPEGGALATPPRVPARTRTHMPAPDTTHFGGHTPDADIIEAEIRQANIRVYAGKPDLVYGGPPCQETWVSHIRTIPSLTRLHSDRLGAERYCELVVAQPLAADHDFYGPDLDHTPQGCDA
jgi:hypothetical protein